MAGKNSPTGRWFFKCIRECEFDGKVWKPGEQFVVPAGTEVPKECFQEMELLPWSPRVDSGRGGDRSGTEMARKKSPKGTWFFKCIRECEFAENVWDRGEVIAVPAGTKVPAKAFKEIGRLPYDTACLVTIYGGPRISVGKDEKGNFRYIPINDLPDYVLRAAKAQPGCKIDGNSAVLSISADCRKAKLAFLEAYIPYEVDFIAAVKASGNTNMALLPPPELEDALDLSGWDMVRRRKFEWALLEEHALWEKSGQPGQFEQWLETRRPGLFRRTGSPWEAELEKSVPASSGQQEEQEEPTLRSTVEPERVGVPEKVRQRAQGTKRRRDHADLKEAYRKYLEKHEKDYHRNPNAHTPKAFLRLYLKECRDVRCTKDDERRCCKALSDVLVAWKKEDKEKPHVDSRNA